MTADNEICCSSTICRGCKTAHSIQQTIEFGDIVIVSLNRTRLDGTKIDRHAASLSLNVRKDCKLRRYRRGVDVGFQTTCLFNHIDGTTKTYQLRSLMEHRGNSSESGHWVTCGAVEVFITMFVRCTRKYLVEMHGCLRTTTENRCRYL